MKQLSAIIRPFKLDDVSQELWVEVSLVKFCWRTLLENAWRLYPCRARSKAGHWQPDPSVKAMKIGRAHV